MKIKKEIKNEEFLLAGSRSDYTTVVGQNTEKQDMRSFRMVHNEYNLKHGKIVVSLMQIKYWNTENTDLTLLARKKGHNLLMLSIKSINTFRIPK